MNRTALGAFDTRILDHLQHNNRITAQELADEIGLSPAACQKRLKRLRESGIIKAEVAILSPEALGLSVTVLVHVLVSRDGVAELDRFKATMAAAPEVMQCYYVTGEHNFALLVALPDMAAYEVFSRRHFIENPDVTSFTTSVVMDRVKTGYAIQVEDGCATKDG